MRKSVLAVVAASSVFAFTIAGANTVTLTGTSELISLDATSTISIDTALCSGTPAISYGYTGSDITSVIIEGVTCEAPGTGFDWLVSVKIDANATETFTASGAIDPVTGVTVTIDPGVAVSTSLASVLLDIERVTE